MFSKFLKRPVLAIVLSVVVIFMGVLAMYTLPTSQFPNIAPPMVIVSASYPGASAKTLTESVIIPLEQAINGAWGMRYMTSDATSAGEANIQIVFNPGTDINQALVQISNRVEQVRNRLPILVQREGVIITPVIPSMLMYVNLFSKDTSANMKFLFNYAGINMIPELQRINGIGQAKILGSRQYAMRIWLNPDRMRAYKVSPDEVMEALAEQSIIGNAGRIGRGDGSRAEALEYVMAYSDRFSEPEEYENVIIKANSNGEILRLKDLAKVALGSEYYDLYSNLNGYPSAAIVLKQTYGSNASEVIASVKKELEQLKESFPPGMEYEISYDVSKFLDASTLNVMHTLRDAFILVALVVFLFLGDWRSTLIPTLAVPISLIGAFFFMQLFGLTINMITLFALVLAIGIVVDDAIVVVEAVHAKMEEEHLSPYNAVRKVLGEISGAVISITLLMTAVFVPVAFMSGPVGVFYRQFSITMASAIVLSGLVALTLTPVLCAMILKNNHGKPVKKNPLTWFLDYFNRGFEKLTNGYVRILRLVAHRKLVTLGLWLAFSYGIYVLANSMPSGFIPSEDQGMLYAIIQTPPGSTLERTNDVSQQLQEKILAKVEGVQSVSSIAGYEVLTEGRGSNAGTCLINLKPWSERHHNVVEIIEELEHIAKEFPGAVIEFFDPPAVPGFGAAGGFALQLLDKTNSGDYKQLEKVKSEFMEALEKREELTGLFTFFSANYPQYEIEIDNELAMQKGVSIGNAMNTLSVFVGSTYELGFIKYQRFFKVFVQSAPEFRRLPEDILDFWVKNDNGEMVPFSAFMKITKKQGANEINRFNMYNTAGIRGTPAKGFSSGQAIKAVQEVAAQTLPHGFDIDWAALSYDESRRGNEAIWIFIIVLSFVYLVLAAQYESFIIPLAVILSLPVGIFGSFLLLNYMGLANDIYAQVGLVMLVGLLGKNAVLIVEFAVQKNQEGATILEAAIEGARVRFRPILMTSFAFIAGLIPLILAHGPGAIGNRTIGASALGGMLFGTVFGVIIIPGLYYIFGSLADGKKLIRDEDFEPLTELSSHEYNESLKHDKELYGEEQNDTSVFKNKNIDSVTNKHKEENDDE